MSKTLRFGKKTPKKNYFAIIRKSEQQSIIGSLYVFDCFCEKV